VSVTEEQPAAAAARAALMDQYHAAVQSFTTEAQAYWTRITAFVLLNSALLVARGALLAGPSNHSARVAIALMGVVTTLVWAHTAVRAHFTSAFWLAFLRDLEERLGMGETGPYSALRTFYSRLRVTLAGGAEARMPWFARGNVNDSTSAILTAVFLAVWIVALVRLA
jgi:hypothetical protein